MPENLQQFLPQGQAAPQAPVTPPAPQNAPQPSGLGGLIQSGVGAVKNAVGAAGNAVAGLFKPKASAPAAPKGIPANLQQFVNTKGGKSTAAPAPVSASKVPSNLQQFITPQKKSSEAPTTNPLNKSVSFDQAAKNDASGLFNKGIDTSTDESTTEGTEGSDPTFARDFISSIPASTWTVFKSLGQNINKSAAEIGVSLAQDDTPDIAKATGVPQNVAGKYVPGTITAPPGKSKNWQAAYGTTSLEGLAYQVSDMEQSIKNSAFAKKLGLDKFALPIAFGSVVGGDSLNFLPGGEGEEGTIDALAKAATTEDAAAILKGIGMSDELTLRLAPQFAEMTDKTEIKDALDTAHTLNSAISQSAAEGASDAEKVVTPEEESEPSSAEESAGLPTAKDIPEVVDAFDKSSGQDDIGTVGDTKVVLGSFGRNAIARKTTAALPDRLPASELQDTLPNVKAVYKAGDSSFRKDNIVLLADMPDGSTRAIVTRQNSNGDEEVVNFFNVSRDKNTFVKNLESFGTPDGTRTRNLLVRTEPPDPLGLEGKDSISPMRTVRNPSSMKSLEQLSRERLAATLAKNESNRSSIFKTEQLPTADVSDDEQAHGLYQTEQSGDIKSGPFKGWSKSVAELYQYGFANKRKADTIQISGAAMRARFESLREQGVDAILKFEGYERTEDGRIVESLSGPDRTGMLGKVASENDRMFAEAREAGVQQKGKLIQYRKNYLRIYIKGPDDTIYDGTTGEVIAGNRGGRRVSRTASFAIPREFDTNVEALSAGYELAFPSIPDLMGARAMEQQKAVADATLFNQGVKHGLVIPAPALSDDKSISGGYKMFDPDRFPQYRTQYRDRNTGILKEYVGPYYGPEKFADKVNNFLYDPNSGNVFQRGLAKTARFVGTTKNIALSIGIPNLSKLGVDKLLSPILGESAAKRITQFGSGLSLHFWNLLPRATLAERAPLQYLRYAMDPEAAKTFVSQNLDQALHYAEQGLTLSAEEHEVSALDLKDLKSIAGIGRQATAASSWLHGVFGEGIFGKVMPAMKLQGTMARAADFLAKGYTQQEAERMAADTENHIWGGLNLDALGRSKDWQNFLRSILIAPDYAETNIKMGVRTAKSLVNWNDKALAPYRNFAIALISAYTAANFIQYETSGSFMVQNDPMHVFSIKAGKDSNGKTRYLNPFGTGVDFARIPLQIATAAMTQNWDDITAVLNNRLSIPLDAIEELRTNTDWAGERIYGTDIYGNPIPVPQELTNIFNTTVGSMLPGTTQTLTDALTGKFSPEQALLQGLALPVGYVNEKPNMTTITQLKADATSAIQNGDYTLFNELVKSGAISSRSRAAFIRDALTGTKTVQQQRTSARDKARIAKEEQALEDEGVTKNTR